MKGPRMKNPRMTSFRVIKRGLLLVFLSLASIGSSAHACIGINVSASDLRFGSYNPLSSFSQQNNFDIQIECLFDVIAPFTFPLAYVVGIDSSLPANNGSRTIKHQSLDFSLDYAIYADSSLSQIVGSITSNDTITGDFPAIGPDMTHRLTGYAIIPGSQNVPSGTYSDQLTITVEF